MMKPVAGESNTNAGVYSISTPVASIESINLATGSMLIKSDGNTFDVALTNVSLNAFNGSYQTKTNTVSGNITVDGQPVTIPATLLDPAFVQATFNSTYACAPDLKEVIPYP